jgi:hypothetical protein
LTVVIFSASIAEDRRFLERSFMSQRSTDPPRGGDELVGGGQGRTPEDIERDYRVMKNMALAYLGIGIVILISRLLSH